MSQPPTQPIFVIGMPRSGTTVLFEALAAHPSLGWPSNFSRMVPGWPVANVARRLLDNRFVHLRGQKKQYGRVAVFNRLLPQPDEAYSFWDKWSGVAFSSSALADDAVEANTITMLRRATAALLRWQGRSRLAAKLTGPDRISFLNAVFPDAIFVHMIRDGRAVIHSLLNVGFWKEQGGFERPFWSDLLTSSDMERWKESEHDPGILAALQWRRVIESARVEAGKLEEGRYSECRYEDLVENPHAVINEILDCAGLERHDAVINAIDAGPRLRNMNDKYQRDFEPAYIDALSATMQPTLGAFGY